VFDGKTAVTRRGATSGGQPRGQSFLWHSLPSDPQLPSGMAVSPTIDMVDAAVHGESSLYGHPLIVTRKGSGWLLRLDGPGTPDITARIVDSITPAEADTRRLFVARAASPSGIATQLAPGVKPDKGGAYWLGPAWNGTGVSRASQTELRAGHRRMYEIDYGTSSNDPWKPTFGAPLTLTTMADPFGGGINIQPAGGKTIHLADGSRATLLSSGFGGAVISYSVVQGPGADDPATRAALDKIHTFMVYANGYEISAMGTFDEDDILDIARSLRPV